MTPNRVLELWDVLTDLELLEERVEAIQDVEDVERISLAGSEGMDKELVLQMGAAVGVLEDVHIMLDKARGKVQSVIESEYWL